MAQPQSGSTASLAPERKMRPLPSMDALPTREALSAMESSMEASTSVSAGAEVDGEKAAAKRRLSKKAPKGAAKVRVKRKSESGQVAEVLTEGHQEKAALAVTAASDSTSETAGTPGADKARKGEAEPRRSHMSESADVPAEGSVPSPAKLANQEHETAEKRFKNPSSAPQVSTSGASPPGQQGGVSTQVKKEVQRPEAHTTPVDASETGGASGDQPSGHAHSRKTEHKAAEKVKSGRRSSTPAVALSPVAEGNEDEDDAQLEDRPEVEVEDGAKYKGQWKGSQRHGRGQLVRRDGFKYEGNFLDGKAHGYGMFTSHQGMYEGEWAHDRAHGHGKYKHADGSTYEGEWDYDNKHGAGEEAWADGSKYRGEFRQGLKHGKGAYRSASGVSYEGQFAEDRMDGYGIYMFPDGRTHIGQWRNGHMNGSGSMQWPNGCKYSGSYKDDLKHGEGSFKWPDGRAYHGQWHMGKQHGTGVMVNTEGGERRAVWHAGECVSCHPDSKSTLEHITSATAAATIVSGSSRSSRAELKSASATKSPTKECGSDSDASSEDEASFQADPTSASRRANDLLLLQGAQLGRGATPNRKSRGSAEKEARADDSKASKAHSRSSGSSTGTDVIAGTATARDSESPDNAKHDNLTPDGSDDEGSPESKSPPRPARTLPVDKDEVADGSRLVLKVPALNNSAQADNAEEVSLRSPRAEAAASGTTAATSQASTAGKTLLRPIPSLAAVHSEPASQAPATAAVGASAASAAAAEAASTRAAGAGEEASKVAPTQHHAGGGHDPETERTEKKAPSLSLIDMMASAVQSVEHSPVEEAAARSRASERVAEQKAQSTPDGNRAAPSSQEDQAKTARYESNALRRGDAETDGSTKDASHDATDTSSSARQREGSRPVLTASEKFYRDFEKPISYQEMMQWMYQLTIDPAVIQTLREESVSAVRCGCLGARRPFFEVPKLNPTLRPSKDFVLNLALTDFDVKDAVHWRMLRALHTTLTRSKECPMTGRHWEVLGFSGSDPCRDLNHSVGSRRFPYPGGVLNVIHLFFFLAHHVEALRHIYLMAIQEEQGFKFFGISMQITRMVLEALLSGKLTRLLNSDPSIWPDNSVYTMLCRVHNAGLFNFFTRWQRVKRRSSSTLIGTCQKVRALMEAKPNKLLEEFQRGIHDLEGDGAEKSRHADGGMELATERFIAGSKSHESGGTRSPASSQTGGKRQMSDVGF